MCRALRDKRMETDGACGTGAVLRAVGEIDPVAAHASRTARPLRCSRLVQDSGHCNPKVCYSSTCNAQPQRVLSDHVLCCQHGMWSMVWRRRGRGKVVRVQLTEPRSTSLPELQLGSKWLDTLLFALTGSLARTARAPHTAQSDGRQPRSRRQPRTARAQR